MKNRRTFYAAGCVLSAGAVAVLSFPTDSIETVHEQKTANQELTRQVSELTKEKENLTSQTEEITQQMNGITEQLERKQTEYKSREEERIQLEDKLWAYSDSIVKYKQENQELLELPCYYYNFEYAAEQSSISGVTGAITDTLIGGTLFGSIIADATKSQKIEKDTNIIQQLCDFNDAASTYIESHAGYLNENRIQKDILEYAGIICQPAEDVGESLCNLNDVEQLLGDKILEGEIQFGESGDLQELIPVYAAANLIASAYYDVYGDSEAYEEWSTFAENCNWRLYDEYTDDDMRAIVRELYCDDLQPLYEAYCNLISNICVFGYQKMDINSVFVMGEGDHRIEYYYQEKEDGERNVVAVKVTDKYSDPMITLCYDLYGSVSAVIDDINDRKYYYYDAVPMDLSMENVDKVTEFADWMWINCYDNVTKIDKKEYVDKFRCFK